MNPAIRRDTGERLGYGCPKYTYKAFRSKFKDKVSRHPYLTCSLAISAPSPMSSPEFQPAAALTTGSSAFCPQLRRHDFITYKHHFQCSLCKIIISLPGSAPHDTCCRSGTTKLRQFRLYKRCGSCDNEDTVQLIRRSCSKCKHKYDGSEVTLWKVDTVEVGFEEEEKKRRDWNRTVKRSEGYKLMKHW